MQVRDVAHALTHDWQSGQALALRFGVSRAALWKAIGRLRAMGAGIEGEKAHGYRWRQPPDWLDAAAIAALLTAEARARRPRIAVAFETDSTNSALLREPPDDSRAPRVLLAEYQSGGRGRRGRTWSSPLGANLYLSLAWTSDRGIAGLGGLSLVVGLALAAALRELGIDAIRLKWPNDLWIDRRKLGGILIEASGEHAGPCRVVIGIGLNHRMPPAAAATIDQAWTDLASATATPPTRSVVAAAVIGALLTALARFERDGVGPFLDDWAAVDALVGLPLRVHNGNEVVDGIGHGVDHQGQLLVTTVAGLRTFAAGEVSVRALGAPP